MERFGVQSSSAATLIKILERPKSRAYPDHEIIFYDNSAESYRWLPPGWVAEERHMKSGRIYRYYYDPAGTMYYTKRSVLRVYQRMRWFRRYK